MHEVTPPARIMVVEDDFLIALMLETELAQAGYTVLGPVATTADALRIAAEQPPDLAILDVNVIGGSTIGVADMLTAQRCAFVFATGYSRLPAELHAYLDVTILRKPIDVRQLLAEVGSLLDSHRARATHAPPRGRGA